MSESPKKRDPRNGLRMSASLATVFTILGHTVFGFEQPVAQVVVALATGYACAFLFEWIDARANGVKPGFAGGGFRKIVDFLLPAHMTSITLSFLLYFGQRLWIMALTVALALGSKYVFRVRQNGRLQHFMNPSNFGIAVVLIVFQWTGVLPWNFTIDIHGVWDVVVPLAILMLGTRLNLLFTGRIPTVMAWLGTFILLGIRDPKYSLSCRPGGVDWYSARPLYVLHDHRSTDVSFQTQKSDRFWRWDCLRLLPFAVAARAIHDVLQRHDRLRDARPGAFRSQPSQAGRGSCSGARTRGRGGSCVARCLEPR